jgi:hypothetical protein
MKSTRRKPNLVAKPTREPKLSRTHAPVNLSPVDWQRGLRRQFGREQAFGLENLGSEPFFQMPLANETPPTVSHQRDVLRQHHRDKRCPGAKFHAARCWPE